MDMCTVLALGIIERWEKRLNTIKCWVHIWVMQSFSMPSESDSIQVHRIIELYGLLSDLFDTWLKVQNMTGRKKRKLPFIGLYDYMTYFTLNTFSTCMTGWGMWKWNQACAWILLNQVNFGLLYSNACPTWKKCGLGELDLQNMQKLQKLLFREIRPRLGEDKKLSKYGIIGKIFLTSLREMPATAHRMMIKILWECRSLDSCMVHPTI